jgi:hypothetical protein
VQSCDKSNAEAREHPILDPQNDHLSFYAPSIADVIAVLKEKSIDYIRQTFREQNVDQVCRSALYVLLPAPSISWSNRSSVTFVLIPDRFSFSFLARTS